MPSFDRLFATLFVLLTLATAPPAAADSVGDCLSEDNERRIAGCSDMIAMPDLDNPAKSLAYAMRALAYSLKGDFGRAMPDYDQALVLDPDSAVALNNRAWVLFKLKQPGAGLADVDRSLMLSPTSAHAHDTRAHINQALGEAEKAKRDYERAISLGGERIIKLYQCGLQAHGLYSGRIDGFYTREVAVALDTCTRRKTCDPLPVDEDCRNATS